MKRHRYPSAAAMDRLGLSSDEQRLIGGFRGLTDSQRDLILSLQADWVIMNARALSDARQLARLRATKKKAAREGLAS